MSRLKVGVCVQNTAFVCKYLWRPHMARKSVESLERRSMLRAILLVVVIVLVLDLLWGVDRGARVTPAARFGRSLALPP
jgi:hypothetical protein